MAETYLQQIGYPKKTHKGPDKFLIKILGQMNDIVSCGGSGNGHYYQETTNSNTCKAWYLYKIDSKKR